jgi:prepilin-type N-terminal cleavage/methylation domain-containing protein
MAARGRRGSRSGFTLLEVVLALTILAMLTAIVYAAFHVGIRAVEKGQGAVVAAQRTRAATDIMRRQLKSMFPYPCDDPEEGWRMFFAVGKGDTSIEFITTSGLLGGSGLEYVKYEVLDDPPRLLMTVDPMFSFKGRRCDRLRNSDLAVQTVLLDGFTSLEFEPNLGEDVRWSEVKRDGDQGSIGLPRAVKFNIRGVPGAPPGVTVASEVPVMLALNDPDEGWSAFEAHFGDAEGIFQAGDEPGAGGEDRDDPDEVGDGADPGEPDDGGVE